VEGEPVSKKGGPGEGLLSCFTQTGGRREATKHERVLRIGFISFWWALAVGGDFSEKWPRNESFLEGRHGVGFSSYGWFAALNGNVEERSRKLAGI